MPHALEDFRYDRIPADHLQQAVETVAKDNGFEKPRYDVRPGSKAGENYGSLLYSVMITDENDSDRKLSLMVKSAVESTAFRKAMKLYRAFNNEANMYNKVLRAYAEKLQDKGLLAEGAVYPDAPRCYLDSVGNGVDDDKDVLILEDMRPQGFVHLDRQQGVDVRHCRLVLSTLARLHAHSLAMEHLQPKKFQRLRELINEVFQEDTHFIKMYSKEGITARTIEMIEKRFPDGTLQNKRVRDYCSRIRQDLLDLLVPSPDGVNVLCHGDCWTNNLLFKYSDSGRVESMCFLDFQMARYGSPVLDLAYFLYTCTEKSLRDEHLDELLRGYHSSLQARLEELGVDDPDSVFSWERLQKHLRERSRIGFIVGIVTIPMLIVDKEDAPDVGTHLENGGSAGDAFMVKFKDTSKRDRRVSDVVEDMVEKGFI